MAVSHVYSSPVADATGTQTIWLGSSTVTVAASDLILPSHWNSVHNQVVTLTGNTAGVAVLTGTNIVSGGSNNVTLSGIQGANAATINVSAAAGGGGGSVNVSAGTTSNNLTNFVFSNANGVSFGLNGSTVTATVQTNYLTTARASTDAVGLNTAQSNVTWTVNSSGISLDAHGYAGSGFTSTTTAGTAVVATQNSNGLSMAVPQFLTTAQPVGAYLTTARASNDAIGLNTAQSNVTWTVNSSGLSLDARGYAGTGTTFNGAGVNGSMTVNSGGVNLSLSVPSGSDTFNAVGVNTIATLNTSGTFANDVYAFSGAGIASVGITNNTVVISVPAGGGGGDGGVFAGVSNLGNTAGSTGTVSTGNFVLVGSNGITLSQSTGGAGSAATITINGPTPLSYWRNFRNPVALAVPNLLSQSSSYIYPVVVEADVSAAYARFVLSMSTNSSSAATTGTTGFSGSVMDTYDLAVFVRQTGANSNSLSRVFYTTVGSTIQNSITATGNGSVWSMTQNITYPVTGGTSSYTTSFSTSQTRFDFSSNSLTLFTGSRFLDFPFATSLSAGNYWVAIGRSSSAATQAVNAITNCIVRGLPAAFSFGGVTFGSMGVNTNSSIGLNPFNGSFSIAAGATTNSLAQSQISFINHVEFYIQLIRE